MSAVSIELLSLKSVTHACSIHVNPQTHITANQGMLSLLKGWKWMQLRLKLSPRSVLTKILPVYFEIFHYQKYSHTEKRDTLEIHRGKKNCPLCNVLNCVPTHLAMTLLITLESGSLWNHPLQGLWETHSSGLISKQSNVKQVAAIALWDRHNIFTRCHQSASSAAPHFTVCS